MSTATDTIVAPATPFGYGGIAVIRLSGPSSKNIARAITFLSGEKKPPFKPRQATHVLIAEKNGKTFDEGLITFFKSPNSYTGEDSFEISCHGNPTIVHKIIGRCCEEGARVAEPGEFTRRSFINGKIDLLQAESVSSLIYSKSYESAALNHRILRGKLSGQIKKIKEKIVGLLTQVEFELDFSEEDLQPKLRRDVLSKMIRIQNTTKSLLNTRKEGRLLIDGALVVIAGKPNVGKSTLLNTLTETDRAITSPTPGTTRDSVEVPLLLGGVHVRFFDTAGIRRGAEDVEREGIRRTKKLTQKADIVLSLYEYNKNSTYKQKAAYTQPSIHIINKADLVRPKELQKLKLRFPGFMFVSAKKKTGINGLKSTIKNMLGVSPSLSSTASLTTTRQQIALEGVFGCLAAGTKLLQNKDCSYELVSFELCSALDSVNSLLGITTPDEIINNIFKSFCVGK